MQSNSTRNIVTMCVALQNDRVHTRSRITVLAVSIAALSFIAYFALLHPQQAKRTAVSLVASNDVEDGEPVDPLSKADMAFQKADTARSAIDPPHASPPKQVGEQVPSPREFVNTAELLAALRNAKLSVVDSTTKGSLGPPSAQDLAIVCQLVNAFARNAETVVAYYAQHPERQAKLAPHTIMPEDVLESVVPQLAKLLEEGACSVRLLHHNSWSRSRQFAFSVAQHPADHFRFSVRRGVLAAIFTFSSGSKSLPRIVSAFVTQEISLARRARDAQRRRK